MAIEIVDFPINSMVLFNSYVKLPEGSLCLSTQSIVKSVGADPGTKHTLLAPKRQVPMLVSIWWIFQRKALAPSAFDTNKRPKKNGGKLEICSK